MNKYSIFKEVTCFKKKNAVMKDVIAKTVPTIKKTNFLDVELKLKWFMTNRFLANAQSRNV